MAIQGVHAMFYSNEAEALRAFLRDKLKLPFTDTGGGWLIFDFAEGDAGVHPTDHPGSPASGTHNVSFFCDDLQATVAELKANGVEFKDEPQDRGYGLVTHFVMPGNVEVELYQPHYQKRAKPLAAPVVAAAKARLKQLQTKAKPAISRARANAKPALAKAREAAKKATAKAKTAAKSAGSRAKAAQAKLKKR